MKNNKFILVCISFFLLIFAIAVSAEWIELGESATDGGISDTSSVSRHASVALGIDGFPFAAWTETTNGNQEIFLKKWDGSNWSEVGSSASGGGISSNNGASVLPSLAVDASGNPAVAWLDHTSGREIYFKKWDGNAWVELGGSATGSGLSTEGLWSEFPSLAIDSNGFPVVAYTNGISYSGYNIYLRHWDGNAWVEVGGSATGNGISNVIGGIAELPALVLDENDNPVVAWHESFNGNYEIYVRRWDGAAWVPYGTSDSGNGISNTLGRSYRPAMALDGNGFPVVAWNEEVGGYDSRLWQTYVKRWDGTNWVELGGSGSGSGLSDTPGTTQGNIRERPSLAIDADNRPVVAWHDNAIGQYELYIKIWDNGEWVELEGSGSNGGVSDNSGASQDPLLVTDADGNYFVGWTDETFGNREIYLKKYVSDEDDSFFEVRPGFNLISFPSADNKSIKKVIADFPLACDKAYHWNGVGWDVYLREPDIGNWLVNSNKGYFVYCRDDLGSATGVRFDVIVDQSDLVNLDQGFSLIGVPESIQASTLRNAALRKGIQLRALYRWQDSSYDVFLDGIGTDFLLEPGKGYWVYSENGGTVTVS